MCVSNLNKVLTLITTSQSVSFSHFSFVRFFTSFFLLVFNLFQSDHYTLLANHRTALTSANKQIICKYRVYYVFSLSLTNPINSGVQSPKHVQAPEINIVCCIYYALSYLSM